MPKCERCTTETNVTTMSKFNTEMICPNCERREKNHPLYAEADAAEIESVSRGDLNFKGIGAPLDLYRPEKPRKEANAAK